MVEYSLGFVTWWERIYDRLGAPVGASMSADIAAIDADMATALDVAALMADVGDASAATLGSLLGILGDPASTITAQIAALNALLVLIQADIGEDASDSMLGSLYGILGDPATDLATTLAVIKMVTDASLVLTETGGTLTTDGNVQTLYINNAPAGEYEPRVLLVDFTNQTVTETLVLNEYYRIRPGGNLIHEDTATYVGAVSPELVAIDLLPNRYGTWVTAQLTAGTNRDYDWAVHYEV